jgi:two-component system KDP operon response regulator KdpE
VLVCDHQPASVRALREVLRAAGFEVDAAGTAKQGLERAALAVPDVAIIELVLPDGDGVELCRRLREWSAMPLMVLSAAGDEDQQVRALEAGADDYLTKPFRPRELVARLDAKLRRAEPAGEQPRVKLNGLEVDLARHVVRREGGVVHLTPIEYKLLGALVRNRGVLLTHRVLLQLVWGAAYLDDTQTLRAHIANLRRKIEPADGPPLIRTDHGLGYRLADWPHDQPAQVGPPQDGVITSELARGRLVAIQDRSSVRARAMRRRRSDPAYGRRAA